jgi:hypothetical protein
MIRHVLIGAIATIVADAYLCDGRILLTARSIVRQAFGV